MTNKESLPKGWKTTTVKKISSSIQYGYTGKKVERSSWRYLRITDIQGGKVNWDSVPFSDVPEKDAGKYMLNNGDILFARTGATAGKSYLFQGRAESIFASYLIRVVSDPKKVIPEFLYAFFQSPEYWGQVQKKIIGTAQPNMNGQKLGSLEIALPPLPVQEAIVAKLTESQNTLNEALESLRDAKEGLDNVMSSAQHKLIPDDESEMPDGWEMVELQEVADINPKKSEVKEVPDDTEISFVPMAAVSERTGTIEDPQIREIGKVRKGYTYFADGDVLFAKITPCMENGKSAIAKDLKNGIGFGTTEFHVIRPSERLKKEFIYAILRSQTFRNIAQQNMTGTAGQARVPTDFLKEYQIALPPVEEQLRVIERLAEIKKQVNAARDFYNEAFSRAQNIQQSLLQKAFKGELVTETEEITATTKQKVDWFKLKQIIGVIIRDLGQKSTLRGEMVLAKFTYLLQELYGAHTGLQFQKHNFGPYSPDIKKAILASAFNKDKFFRVSGSGNAQVYALGQNSDKLFKYESEEVQNAESGMAELMEKVASLPSDKIELLATVCKIIQDSQSDDPEIIWQEMEQWETEKRDTVTKAERFDRDSVNKCLDFIKTQGWEAKLMVS